MNMKFKKFLFGSISCNLYFDTLVSKNDQNCNKGLTMGLVRPPFSLLTKLLKNDTFGLCKKAIARGLRDLSLLSCMKVTWGSCKLVAKVWALLICKSSVARF